jgi:replicative DNA helicase
VALDTVLLRLMKDRKVFTNLYGVIPKDTATVDKATLALLADFNKYFLAFPSHDKLDRDTFLPRFLAWHPTLKAEQVSYFEAVLSNVFSVDADEDQRNNIMQWLAEVEMVTAMANMAEEHNQGDLEDAFSRATAIIDTYRKRIDVKYDRWIDTDIRELLKADMYDEGIAWRLTCLNNSMRKLRPGDFGIIAGRPDKGKTTFIASEVTWMASQLPPDKNVLWLNNEGPGERIVPRLYQAALGMSVAALSAIAPSGEAEKRYVEIVGRRDRIRVQDIHGKTNGQVEMMIEDSNPGIIIYDMIDNISGFGGEARTDLALEKMYQWARERSVKYGAIGFATSQISADGDGQMFPTLAMLKDSKTGKQGACDFQLMIGASNEPTLANSRYISLPKNKLRRVGGVSDPRCEVHFDGVIGRYTDVLGSGETLDHITEQKPLDASTILDTSELDSLLES